MDNNDEHNGITRREFATRVGAAAAGIAVGGEFFNTRVGAAPHVGNRILGANDRVVTAIMVVRPFTVKGAAQRAMGSQLDVTGPPETDLLISPF